MNHENYYDCAIIGGGLAGLTLSIRLRKAGYKIIVFEKEQYPFHKVCGEYISFESWNYLESLGLPLSEMNLPVIDKLIVTSPGGTALQQKLSPGGFGISRYTLDHALKIIAIQQGVHVMENCKVEDAIFENEKFGIITSKGKFFSRVCCGSFGKRSNIDVRWKRNFIQQLPNKLNNYIGVKYHIHAEFPGDTIALHNFKNGYCGISKIEENKYCLCYLTNAASLKENNNSLEEMEKNMLCKNPHLEKIFKESKKIYSTPLSISQISFQEKSVVEHHILMIGDAAGMITPLCGNGMSMAMHGGKIASVHIISFLQNKTDRSAMEELYVTEWHKTFGKRLNSGRMIQKMFGKVWVTDLFIKILKIFPFIGKVLIKKTHGKSF